eukprot:TRINITY_DN320_c0_g3_i2.p1 TRINITY_DN320_c0_g3~~TRINITY_DN320_c0_g3_i2.p1  ORF type:complete len:111 (-),score=17.25 TRINITY_DN320_c0_g3_i2:131-463(-)
MKCLYFVVLILSIAFTAYALTTEKDTGNNEKGGLMKIFSRLEALKDRVLELVGSDNEEDINQITKYRAIMKSVSTCVQGDSDGDVKLNFVLCIRELNANLDAFEKQYGYA